MVLDSAAKALAETPELLPVLKKAGVVDAGGQGLLLIYQGMAAVFGGGAIVPAAEEDETTAQTIHPDFNAAGEFDGEITFTYCTEFIVLKNDRKGDSLKLRAFLESIGDSAVVVDDGEIIKCHVHTDNPGSAIQEALKFGMLNNLKIDNMRLQHEVQQKASAAKGQNKVPIDPDRPNGFVAVAAGDGVHQLFADLGVDQIVSGGQTMNPSTQNILAAVMATPAKKVYVLPNNKNIIMAAQQAVELTKDRTVVVVPTKTIPQGIAAMLAFDPDLPEDSVVDQMMEAAGKVTTGQVTFAARDSEYGGFKIKEGEILTLKNGKLLSVEKDPVKAAVKLAKTLCDHHTAFVTLIYGEDISEQQAQEAKDAIQKKLGTSVDITLVRGGQPVYYFIISVE